MEGTGTSLGLVVGCPPWHSSGCDNLWEFSFNLTLVTAVGFETVSQDCFSPLSQHLNKNYSVFSSLDREQHFLVSGDLLSFYRV